MMKTKVRNIMRIGRMCKSKFKTNVFFLANALTRNQVWLNTTYSRMLRFAELQLIGWCYGEISIYAVLHSHGVVRRHDTEKIGLQSISCCTSSVISQKGESQNGCFQKTKHAKFSEKRTYFTPLIRTHLRNWIII